MQFILQKKSLILSILFFLLTCSLFILFHQYINDIREKSQVVQEKLQLEALQRENTDSINRSIRVIEPERILLENHFVKSSDIVPFLDSIEKLAQDVGVEAEISSVDLLKEGPSLTVEMRARGNFGAIYKLITLLENSQYETEFVFVDIKKTSLEDLAVVKSPQWEAILKIKLLSFVN